MIRDPRIALDMLFGSGNTNADRARRRNQAASILDAVVGQSADLRRQLGSSDGQRVDKYLEDIRELERRIQAIETRNSSGETREIPEAPAAVPDNFGEHMRLMFDFQVLAMQSDMTRVFSFKTSRDASNRSYPDSGTTAAFHLTSHHSESQAKITEFNTINRYFVSQLPYFLGKLKETKEGDSNLLEKSLILYGSPMGDSNFHNHRRCPLILLGHANGALKGNVHLQAQDQTPMANVMLSAAHAMGLNDMTYFGDSTAAFPLSG
jgi:hypothetical protein